MSFSGRIILLGYGTIGECALPMLMDALPLPPERYRVIDGEDRADRFGSFRDAGIDYRVMRLDADNLDRSMSELGAAGDIVVNVSVGVDSICLSDWCQSHGLMYIDTALEPWEETLAHPGPVPWRTEYALHHRAREQAAARWRARGPTAVFTHGANPGLVSHFVKAALTDIARTMKLEIDPPGSREEWAALAERTGTRVIHVSERDTQISKAPKRPGEFVNTWSIPGLIEEAAMPGEIGWGTHEKRMPACAQRFDFGPGNAIYFPYAAALLVLRSWVPLGGQIAGLALPHSECITVSDYLTVFENGTARYRPTVAFAYLPCDAALASLHETMMGDWAIPREQRILKDADIVSGRDELGVLLLGHPLGGWWFGSQLDIAQGRRLLPGTNPTAIQVAAGVLGATLWAVRNPERGFCEPEHLPHEEILELARPYLGTVVSEPTGWTPLDGRGRLFDEPWVDREDPWQFANFLVRA